MGLNKTHRFSSEKREKTNDDVNVSNIPKALTEYKHWVCWQYVPRDNGQLGKKPVNPESQDAASVTDPNTWRSIDVAEAVHSAENTEDTDGIGFVFSDDDPFVGLDLDNCVQGGELADWARDIVERLDSYTEYSPSGTGVHIIVEGTLPDGGNRNSDVEMYESSRYFTVTGNHLEGTPTMVEDSQTAMETVHKDAIVEGVAASDATTDQQSESTKNVAGGPSDTSSRLTEIEATVTDQFDEQTWAVTEAALAAHATLLLDGPQNCTGLIIVGETGAGKTTVLRFFEQGLDDMVYRSDDLTPASFVSQDASQAEEQLEEVDLLPRIKHKTLLVRDMSTWFTGDRDAIGKRLSNLAHVLDGEGFTRDAGSHGRRGYQGDYRFAFLGATTPLKPRVWDQMGHTGNRFVFVKMPGTTDVETAVEDVFEENEYGDRIDKCRGVVQDHLQTLWEEHGGYGSVNWSGSPDDDMKEVFTYLTKLVVTGRAPLDEGTPVQEGSHRIATALRDIARGHALLDGRRQVELADAQVCARIALSTMPQKRRPVIRTLLNPEIGNQLTAQDLEVQTGLTRPTVHKRMELLDDLGVADFTEVKSDDRDTKQLELTPEFVWPEALDFPNFERR